jgi:hypothetical protein
LNVNGINHDVSKHKQTSNAQRHMCTTCQGPSQDSSSFLEVKGRT